MYFCVPLAWTTCTRLLVNVRSLYFAATQLPFHVIQDEPALSGPSYFTSTRYVIIPVLLGNEGGGGGLVRLLAQMPDHTNGFGMELWTNHPHCYCLGNRFNASVA
jgi:hypothetical protein